MSTISKFLANPPDNFSTQISSSTVATGALSIDLDSTAGLPTEGVGQLFKKDSSGNVVQGSIEFIHWTGALGNTITLTDTGDRGLTGSDSGAQAYVADDYFEVWVSSYYQPTDGILVEHAADGTHDDTVVATLTGTQTLTNKTLTSPTVTSPTINGAITLDTAALASLPSQDSIYRQAIMNGDFQVSQRATTFVSGANNDDVYTLDRWNLISDGNDVFDVSQEATEVPDGAAYSIKLDVETAKRGGIVQFLENKDAKKFKGKSVSVSFSVKSANIAALRCAVLSWGSTADAVTSDVVGTWAATPTWAANWTAENTPADLTVTSDWTTVKVENIAIDSATVNNLALVIWTPNEETIGDIVYITNVQMNEGAVALPFQPKSFEEELRACQRYYERHVSGDAYTNFGTGLAFSTSATNITVNYVAKRTTPTCAVSNVALIGAGGTTVASIGFRGGISTGGIEASVSGAPLTVNTPYVLRGNNNTAAYVEYVAEL